MYWDGEATPSVEVPLGDFFCNGHGLRYNVTSLPVCVNPSGGFNCYWPMPFRKGARITIENQRPDAIGGFFYQITYGLGEIPDAAAYFHAQWRIAMTTREYPEHVLLDGITGRGQYVGTAMAWAQFSNGWWGEGEIKFFLDGDQEFPTICGTGTEDYFLGAWGFGDTFSTPFAGYPLWTRGGGEVPAARAVPLAHLRPDPVQGEPEGDDAGAGVVAERRVPAADGRDRVGGVLVPDGTARCVPGHAAPRRALRP